MRWLSLGMMAKSSEPGQKPSSMFTSMAGCDISWTYSPPIGNGSIPQRLRPAMQEIEPLGKVYLPEGSYREMTEWAMPAERQRENEEIRHQLEESSQWQRVSQFVRGGFWRNFKTRYPESNEMYARMMQVSGRLAELSESSGDAMDREILDQARVDLYRAQCNCSYWHGAFGGIYLPHLRNAVFKHLIQADSLLEQASGRSSSPWCTIGRADFNFDGQDEVQLSNNHIVAFIEPAAGGQLYELDIRNIAHNLLATLARRPEAYHQKVLSGPTTDQENVASIHDRIVFKQEGLDQLLQYDSYSRNSLIDHFYSPEATLQEVLAGTEPELGDFVDQCYQLETDHRQLTGGEACVQAVLQRQSRVFEYEIIITKRISLREGASTLDVDYLIEGLPTDRTLHFAIEWNFAGMPAAADGRYFYDPNQQRLGGFGKSDGPPRRYRNRSYRRMVGSGCRPFLQPPD